MAILIKKVSCSHHRLTPALRAPARWEHLLSPADVCSTCTVVSSGFSLYYVICDIQFKTDIRVERDVTKHVVHDVHFIIHHVTFLLQNGRVSCRKEACPVLNCPDKYIYTPPGSCCPLCHGTRSVLDPPGGKCLFKSTLVNNSQTVKPDRCTQCVCTVSITNRPPKSLCVARPVFIANVWRIFCYWLVWYTCTIMFK